MVRCNTPNIVEECSDVAAAGVREDSCWRCGQAARHIGGRNETSTTDENVVVPLPCLKHSSYFNENKHFHFATKCDCMSVTKEIHSK